MPDLRLRGIARCYPAATPVDALRGIDLEILQGDFLAIEGPSGGGKSTLLNIIGLLDAPTGGAYLIDGMHAAGLSDVDRTRLRSQHFAFIFQNFHLLDHRPVVDSVELGLLYRGIGPGERRRRAVAALQEVGLSHRTFHRAALLSGGERQRVAIARALAARAPVVVADEPTGNLDSENSRHVVDSLRRLHRSGATVVLVTHSPDVASVASRRVVIRDGRLISESDDNGEHVADSSRTDGSYRSEAAAPGLLDERRPASRLRFPDLVRDAARSLRSRVARASGLVAAVALGVALFVGTAGLSGAAAAQVSRAFDAHSNRDVTVGWNAGEFPDSIAHDGDSLSRRLESLAGVDAAGVLIGVGQTSVQAGEVRPAYDVDGYAMTSRLPRAARLTIRWADGRERAPADGEVLLGSTLAHRMELAEVDAMPVIVVSGRPMTVVGIIDRSPRFPQLLGGVVQRSPAVAPTAGDHVQAVLLTRAGAAQQVARQAPLLIDPADPSALDVSAPADPDTLRNRVQSDLQLLLLAFTGIAVLASITGLTNSMVLSVVERTPEIGLRRAVGATPRQVSGLILVESVLTGAAGGVLGLAVGLAGLLAITIAQRWTPVFDLRLALAAVLAGVAVGALGGIIAATRASAIPPHEALRS